MRKSEDLKSAIYGCVLGTVVGLSLISLNSVDDNGMLGKSISISDIADDDYKLAQPDEIKKQISRLNYVKNCVLLQQSYIEKKNEVLNNYKECNTISDILKRQDELENLKLTDDDKIYKDCPASAEIQHFIYEQSIINKIPFDYMMSIVYTETRGMFNASGEISYNSNSCDLGYTQQNSVASLPLFKEKYDLTYDEAYSLLLNNDYANVCAAFIMVDEIAQRHSEYNPYEYAGCYNGWLGWRNYEISRDYVYNHFSKAYDEVFTEHHQIEVAKYEKIKSVEDTYVVFKK